MNVSVLPTHSPVDKAPEACRISIVAHGLRAGGGLSVGKNFMASVTRAMPDAIFQIFVPEGLGYEDCVDEAVHVMWHGYRSSFGKAGRWFFDKYSLPKTITEFEPSLIICLGNVGVRGVQAPQMLLIQDAHYFYPSKYYSREPWWQKLAFRYMRYHFSQDLKKTDVLLCQTRTAMSRIRSLYGFKGPVVLLPNAISAMSIEGGSTNEIVDSKIDAEKFCIFYLTRYYTHKNIEILIDLFIKYRSDLSETVLYLTISEDQHRNVKKILESIRKNELENNIVNIGPVKQEEISAIYSKMGALVMPSTLESFSGTYMEAMRFSCPVITSDMDFAREVCGDAALYFNPWDVDDLFARIMQLKDDPELGEKLKSNGNTVILKSDSSWEKNAEIIRSLAIEMVA